MQSLRRSNDLKIQVHKITLVDCYWFFTLVFECPIPNTLYDFSLVPRPVFWMAYHDIESISI